MVSKSNQTLDNIETAPKFLYWMLWIKTNKKSRGKKFPPGLCWRIKWKLNFAAAWRVVTARTLSNNSSFISATAPCTMNISQTLHLLHSQQVNFVLQKSQHFHSVDLSLQIHFALVRQRVARKLQQRRVFTSLWN